MEGGSFFLLTDNGNGNKEGVIFATSSQQQLQSRQQEPSCEFGSVFFVCGLSFYLGMVDSHLLLSLAGSVHCDTAPALVKHSCP